MCSKYLSSPEWTDDQKAAVLFAPFREKSLNPHSWERKMKFWTDALLECCQSQNDIVLDLKSLTDRFERQGKYPKCLNTVAMEMLRAGQLQRLSDFQRQSNSWKEWGFDILVRRPLAWGLTKLISSPASDEAVFILPEQVKKKAKEVLDYHYSQVQHETTDNMMELSTFRTQCLQVLRTEEECDIILKQLELDHKVLITKDKDGTMIIKICDQSEHKVLPVQDIELNIRRIQRVMNDLEQQIEALSGQLDMYTTEARKFVKEGKKSLALHQLRKRRTLQRQVDKKSSCYDTLHGIIHRIEDASSNDMVVKAYESGLSAIKQLTGDMTMNKVDKVLDDLQEVFGEQEEINQAIADVSLAGSDVSMDELDQELNSLLAGGSESRGDQAGAESNSGVEDLVSSLASYTLDDLPDVPSSPPRGQSQPSSPRQNLSYAS